MTNTAPPQDVSTSREFFAFGQVEGPGTEAVPLGSCMAWDSAPDPRPGKDPIWCIANGQWAQVGNVSTAPSGLPQFTLTPWVQDAAHWLEQVKEAKCPFNLFLINAPCGANTWASRRRAWGYRQAIITDDVLTNPMQRDADGAVEHPVSITADYGRSDTRLLTFVRLATIETAALNSITSEAGQCPGICGPYKAEDLDLWMSAATVAAGIPDLVWSNDAGATFTTPASGFAATESVMATQTIKINENTTRVISVRDTDAANPLEVQYTDDDGVTPVLVVVGASAAEAAVGGSSLFAYNAENIWLATDDGRVYFSSDHAETWTDQTTALAASGAAALNAIHFATALIGYAVGAGDVVIYTTDGGANWGAGTATGSGDGLNTVHVFDANRVIVGTDNAVSTKCVYMTYDQTANWTTIDEGLAALTTDTCPHITFLGDGMVGYLIKNTVAPLGTVYRSIDGGFSWKAVNAVTNAGLNFLHIIHANLAYVVGELNVTSFIGRISG